MSLENSQLQRLAAVLAPPDAGAVDGDRARVAAVAAILRTHPQLGPQLLLITRAERAGDVWSGHVALPGGRSEPGDRDIVDTARRETMEEVAVDLATPGSILLGALDVLQPMSSYLPQIVVHPLVWHVREAEPRLSDEVAGVHWVELDYLRRVEHRIEHRMRTPEGSERSFPAITLVEGGAPLWGMTLRIVLDLLDALDRGLEPRRAPVAVDDEGTINGV
jgi:8-oxo-dGTP pyrophosphatase MutT (NUDIX family)